MVKGMTKFDCWTRIIYHEIGLIYIDTVNLQSRKNVRNKIQEYVIQCQNGQVVSP